MPKRVLITGASGLIGTQIVNALLKRGDSVTALTANYSIARKKIPANVNVIEWHDYLTLVNEKIDAIINLSGKNVGENRWNKKIKKEIYESRIQSTRKVVDLISKMLNRPEVLINTSGVDYYGARGDEEINEDSAPGYDFLSEVCIDWEKEAYNAVDFGVRVVIIRNGFVLAKNSNAIKRLTLPFRLFAGGTIGSGKQYISWVHIDDLVNIYLFALDNRAVSGSINATAPNPVTMKVLCKTIGSAIHKPVYLHIPSFAVKIAAGEMSQVVLSGRKALPHKLNSFSFKFGYQNCAEALREIVS